MQFTNQFTTFVERPNWQKTPDGFLRCPARVLAQRIMPYAREELSEIPESCTADPIMMLVTVDAMQSPEALRSLEGAAIVDWDHNWVTPETYKTFSKGNVAGTPIIDGTYTVCDLLATDPQTIADLEAGKIPEISAAYLADTLFEEGTWNGQHYDAVQTNLRYNHIALIPRGHGRAGEDVRILNKNKKEGGCKMEIVKVRLSNGKFINTDEEGAEAIAEDQSNSEVSAGDLQKKIEELEGKLTEAESLTGEIEELKGEPMVYKQKLDELLAGGDGVDEAAEEMIEEQQEAEEIIENSLIEETEDHKEKVKNSLRGEGGKRLRGESLYRVVLQACNVKHENLSSEGVRGAFKALSQMVKNTKTEKKVAGTKLFNSMSQKEVEVKQTALVQGKDRLRLGAKG